MWLIETQGPSLDGKVRWLRPGKSYVVGRMKKEADIVVDSKSVSRKHVTISIDAPLPGSCGQTSTKSRITVKDMDTSFGTFVDSRKLAKGETFEIPPKTSSQPLEYSLKVGKATGPEVMFKIWWKPIVVTLSTGQESARHDELQQSLEKTVEPLDIKLLPVMHPTTTHFVKATEKNSAKVLVAMVKALPIVTPQFVDALAVSADAMELDFNAQFPDPAKFLPEPRFQINPKRADLLANRNFVFFDQRQYDSLWPMISAAAGIAVYCALVDVALVESKIQQLKGQTYLVRPLSSSSSNDGNISSNISELAAKLPTAPRVVNQMDFLKIVQDADASLLDQTSSPKLDEQSPAGSGVSNLKRNAENLLTESFLTEPASKRPRAMRPPGRRTEKIDPLAILTAPAVQTSQTADSVEKGQNVQSQETPVAVAPSRPQRRRYADNSLLNPVDVKKRKVESNENIPPPKSPSPTPTLTAAQPESLSPKNASQPASVPPQDQLTTIEPSANSDPTGVLLEPNTNPSDASQLHDTSDQILHLTNLAIVETSFPLRKKQREKGNNIHVYDVNRPNFKLFKKAKLLVSKKVAFIEAPESHTEQVEAEQMFETRARTRKQPEIPLRSAAPPESPGLFIDSNGSMEAARVTPATNHLDDDSDDEVSAFRFSR